MAGGQIWQNSLKYLDLWHFSPPYCLCRKSKQACFDHQKFPNIFAAHFWPLARRYFRLNCSDNCPYRLGFARFAQRRTWHCHKHRRSNSTRNAWKELICNTCEPDGIHALGKVGSHERPTCQAPVKYDVVWRCRAHIKGVMQPHAGSLKEVLLRKVLGRRLVRVSIETEVLRRVLRRGGGCYRRRLEGRNTPFRRVRPPSRAPYAGPLPPIREIAKPRV